MQELLLDCFWPTGGALLLRTCFFVSAEPFLWYFKVHLPSSAWAGVTLIAAAAACLEAQSNWREVKSGVQCCFFHTLNSKSNTPFINGLKASCALAKWKILWHTATRSYTLTKDEGKEESLSKKVVGQRKARKTRPNWGKRFSFTHQWTNDA